MRRASIRSKYDLRGSDFLITFGFAGEPASRAPAQLDEILRVKGHFDQSAVFAFRFHPAHPQRDFLWERVVESGLLFIDARAENLLDLYIASDAVVADYVSTDAYKNLLMGIPTISMLFPDDYDYRLELGYPKGVPPVISEAKEWGPTSPEAMVALLDFVHHRPTEARHYMRAVRAEPFRELLEPGAAERIAQEVLGCMKGR